MLIAEKLRQKSIMGYLLYMWQVEDVIRAHGCDLENLRHTYLPLFRIPPDRQEEVEEWYADLIDMMRREGVTEKGHLQINKGIISLLTDLHLQLLSSSKYPFYNAEYFKILPFIAEIRAKGDKADIPEIENCFDIIYGVLTLKMQHKKISKETEQAEKEVSRFLTMLSDYYNKDKAGELEF